MYNEQDLLLSNPTFGGNDTYSKIVRSAHKLFVKKGYKATTMRDIAADADVTLGLLPYYFKNKENLAGIVWHDIMRQFYCRQESKTEWTTLNAAEQLYAMNLLIYDFLFNDTTYNNFFFELSVFTKITEQFSEDYIKLLEIIFEDYDLHLEENEKRIYFAAMNGSSRQLIHCFLKKEIDLDFVRFVTIIFTDFFYNIGINQTEIKKIICNVKTFLKIND